MIHLAWPWMALALPVPWILYRWRRAAAPQGSALFLPFAAALATPRGRAARTRPSRQLLLFSLVWVLLVIAAMRPQWLGKPVPVPTDGRRVMLAVDVSGSMATEDMAGGESRLHVVKDIAGRFIDTRQGDQVGLILFGTHAYVQAPLTDDLATVHQFLDQSVVGIAGSATAIGDAIGLTIKRLLADPPADQLHAANLSRSVMILLTDGGNDAGILNPLQAARLAAQTRLRIYTIGVGAAVQQGIFGMSTGNTDLDIGLLKQIARITGGRFFRATDENTLQEVYEEIDRLNPAAGRAKFLRPTSEWYAWPLGLALLLSVPAVWSAARAWS